MRLGFRLLLAFFLIVGLATFFVLRVFVEEVKPGIRQAMEATLVDAANVLAEVAAEDVVAGHAADGELARRLARAHARDLGATVWQFRKDRVAYRVTITDTRGVVIYDSHGQDLGSDHSRWNDVYRTLRGQYGARSSPEVPGQPERTVMHVAAPIYAPRAAPGPSAAGGADAAPGAGGASGPSGLTSGDGRPLLGVLTVSQPNRAIEPFIAAGQANIVRRGGWLIGLSAGIAGLMTWWLVARLGRLRRYALAVSAGERVAPPPRSRDELGDLGQALEHMRRKLDGKAYVEEYVQSLTHELKSPLAAIRGAAELLQDPLPDGDRQRFVGHIQAQERRLTETIDKLLVLAEVERHGWLQQVEDLDVPALIAQAVEDATAKAAAAGVSLARQADVELPPLRGDGYLLRQALSNLLDNAIAFSPPGAEVKVGAHRDQGALVFTVQDHGPGIPDYAEPRVFERFYSLPRPGSGARSSGLGLPFVQEVARLHGGQAAVRNRAEGGAEATLRVPLAQRHFTQTST